MMIRCGHLALKVIAGALTTIVLCGLLRCGGFYLPRLLGQPYSNTATTYGDFDYYFEAASRFLHDPATLYDRGQMMAFMGYVYPPPGILFFVPFVPMGQAPGFIAFSLVSLASGYLAAWLMAVWIPGDRRPFGRWTVPLFVLAVAASTPFYANLFSAQFNLVVLCCCAGAILAGSRGFSFLGGLLLAIACWMKIYPGILLLVLLGLRTFRSTAVNSMIIGTVLPFLLLPVLPSELYFNYFLDALPQLSGQSLVQIDNQSITAALSRLVMPMEQWPQYLIVKTASPVRLANTAAALLLLGLMFWRGAVTRGADRRHDVSLALCALACVPLFSPQGWGHAYVFSVPLITFLAIFDPRPAVRVLAVLGWLALFIPASHVFPGLEQLPAAAGALVYTRYTLTVSAAILLTLLLPPDRRPNALPTLTMPVDPLGRAAA